MSENKPLVERTLWGEWLNYHEPDGADGTRGKWDLSGAMYTVLKQIESRLSTLEHPAEQGKGKWIDPSEVVWRAYQKHNGGPWFIDKIMVWDAHKGDLIQPYDPEHPEPPSPPEAK
jgi:hypothetical protein